MTQIRVFFCAVGLFLSLSLWAQEPPFTNADVAKDINLETHCLEQLKRLPGRSDASLLKKACSQVKLIDGCKSAEGTPIFHLDREGATNAKVKSQKIFVMSLIHGDELPSGSVARSWMERLQNISPRNSWRVIPIANPDGLKRGTRTNAKGVDLNRNFPSKNWDAEALKRWSASNKKDPRRYPGPSGGSEIETQCLVKQIDDFKPDFIISVHTPLAVLDFDGPKIDFPKSAPLPWAQLGTYPGSLGQFQWVDRKVPVLTIELTPDGGVDRLERFDNLQDEMGTLAIRAYQKIQKPESESKKK